MNTPTEHDIQTFWSDRPMLYTEKSLSNLNEKPEETFTRVEEVFRDKGRHFQEKNAPLLSRFIDYASMKDKKVLEIGCGVGWFSNEFLKAGAKVEAIDLSREHVRLSKYRFSDNPNFNVQVASAEKIPFADNTFDFVCSWGVLHHASNDEACYRELHRVLKPEGKAFLMLYRKGGAKYWYHKVFRRGVLKGELIKHKMNITSLIQSATDAYQSDSPGAPISRHYTRSEMQKKFAAFSECKLQITGNAHEWAAIPFHRLPLTDILGEKNLIRLSEISGAYWLVSLKK